MKRLPSYSNLRGSKNGVNGTAKGVHDDLHFDMTPRPHTSYSQGTPERWSASPPPVPASLQPKPPPQQPPPQWAPPPIPPINQFFNGNQGDFLDMPDPSTTPIPAPLPTLPPRYDAFVWNTNDNPRRPSPQPSPGY